MHFGGRRLSGVTRCHADSSDNSELAGFMLGSGRAYYAAANPGAPAYEASPIPTMPLPISRIDADAVRRLGTCVHTEGMAGLLG
jgi:hypothetical protein